MGYKGKRIGFRSNDDNETEYEKAMRTHEILSQASYDVLLDSIEEYGILTELLGRIPSIVALAPLSKEELRKILLDTDHSPIKLQQKLFADNGYQLVFTEAFVDECIEKAFKMSTGARALKSIIRLAVSEAAFDLLGESTDEEFEEEELEIINFKGAVVIDSSSLINPCAYFLKDKLVEDKNIEMSISI
jgi:ATP-dependent protease Clp ATPase subunit